MTILPLDVYKIIFQYLGSYRAVCRFVCRSWRESIPPIGPTHCGGFAQNLNILQWVMQKRCPWSEYVEVNAVSNCRYDILAWLIDNDYVAPCEIAAYALKRGYLPVVIWCGKNYNFDGEKE